MNWEQNLIEDDEQIRDLLLSSPRVAVLGIRSEAFAERPPFYVPQYLDQAGYAIVPVPVVEPEVKEILGKKVYRKVADVPGQVDLVQVFRKPEDIPAHFDDIMAKKPAAVWFQPGIRNDEVAERFARAGVKVVQDRCMMVEHRRLV